MSVRWQAAKNLRVNPGNLVFEVQQGGSPSPAQLLQVTSSPSGQSFSAQVRVTIVGNNWLKLDPTNGLTPSPIAVTVDPALLGIGQRSASIIVSLNGTDETAIISVTALVSSDGGGGGGADSPSIGVEPAALSFGASVQGVNPAPRALAIRNTGTGTLSYALEVVYPGQGPTGWMQLSAAFGTSTGSPSTHQVSADIAGLPAGQFLATIRITGNAANSPRNVLVSLTIGSAPAILLEPGSLEVSGFEGGASSATQTLRISSAETPGLSYQVTTNQPWLTVSPASGNTDSGPRLHNVRVDLAALSPGTFLGLVSVESAAAANSPQTALVTLTVHPAGLLSASPGSFSFFGPAGSPVREKKILNLFSTALESFSWIAAVSPPQATWLRLSPAEGGVPGNLFVEIDNAGLAAGRKDGGNTHHSRAGRGFAARHCSTARQPSNARCRHPGYLDASKPGPCTRRRARCHELLRFGNKPASSRPEPAREEQRRPRTRLDRGSRNGKRPRLAQYLARRRNCPYPGPCLGQHGRLVGRRISGENSYRGRTAKAFRAGESARVSARRSLNNGSIRSSF